MVDVNYQLEGANGDVIVFDSENFVLNTGISGFGIPPTAVRIEDSAGDGGVWRHTKRSVRDVDLPITVFGANRDEVQAKLRRLGTLLQDGLGAPKLRAVYDNGDELYLEVHYVGGGETLIDNNEAGQTWCRWVISLRAPNPYWRSGIEESFSISTGYTGRGLLPELSKMKVSSSTALGVVTVVNAGDVATYPVWSITGPVQNLQINNGTLGFSFPVVYAGQTITVDTETSTVVDQDGLNRYDYLGPAPKFFNLPPGTTGISVLGINTDFDFNVTLTYSPRYEVIH